ncbi:esterase/lipase family protein [Paenarthrobacter sp. NPDC057355]|uniref:esterase/lipase family protein n=1 Tax=Paenarthrobacter sp. NPDC057355 TaxID=3346105 RepID=UPI003645D062
MAALLSAGPASAKVTPSEQHAEIPNCESVNIGAALRPVLLVHGFDGSPASWGDDSRRTLGTTGGTCVSLFDYSTASTQWVTDTRIGKSLANRIMELAAQSSSVGGIGKVALVGHSMGGLAIRCALNEACSEVPGTAAKTAAVATLGTPNLGSFWLSKGLNTTFSVLRAAFCSGKPNTFCKTLGTLMSPAGQAFIPGSDHLGRLPAAPASLPVYAVATPVKIVTSFFGRQIPIDADLGDLLVRNDSALQTAQSVKGLGGPAIIDCGTEDISKGTINSRCWHGGQPNIPEAAANISKFINKAFDKADKERPTLPQSREHDLLHEPETIELSPAIECKGIEECKVESDGNVGSVRLDVFALKGQGASIRHPSNNPDAISFDVYDAHGKSITHLPDFKCQWREWPDGDYVLCGNSTAYWAATIPAGGKIALSEETSLTASLSNKNARWPIGYDFSDKNQPLSTVYDSMKPK